MHFTVISIIFATLICNMSSAASLVDRKSPINHKCLSCDNSPECYTEPPSDCLWGDELDHCGRRICAKGPGERCDDVELLKLFKHKFTLHGKCGAGMWCQKEDKGNHTCQGCFAESLVCYPPFYKK